jgi:hypothetical protein
MVLVVHYLPQTRDSTLKENTDTLPLLAIDALGEVDEVVLELGGISELDRVGLKDT